MKKEHLLELLVPNILHLACSVATIVLAAEVLKKVNHIHKDVKILEEKRGLLKLIARQVREHREEKREEKKKEEKK